MKVGDYVRTKKGTIYQFNSTSSKALSGAKKYMVKSSPNIIDLIEEHDLLKIEYYSLRYNERVIRLFEVTFKDNEYINLSNAKCEFMLVNGDFNKGDKELEPIIKSIVTKEQFESMEYKVGE